MCTHRGILLFVSPDITVVTPVFDDEDRKKIIFFTASRGHHADVGGKRPGSMPPDSKTIFDEGVSIETFKVIKRGQFDEAGLTKLLMDIPDRHPGACPTRTLADNLSDIKAQIAACYKGVTLIKSLIKQHTFPIVNMYMHAIQDTSEMAVRKLLKGFAEVYGRHPLEATDYMDDGTPIKVKLDIDSDGSATLDFSGTGPEVYGIQCIHTAFLQRLNLFYR